MPRSHDGLYWGRYYRSIAERWSYVGDYGVDTNWFDSHFLPFLGSLQRYHNLALRERDASKG